MTHECGANIAVQNCFRGIGVRTGFPAQLQDVRGRNSAAPAQSGEAAGGPLPPRKQLPHRARRRPTHRHDGRAGQTALLARRKTRQHRPLSSTGPKDLRNPLAVRPAEPPQRDGVSGIAEIAARVRPKPALQPGGHLRHRPPAKTLQAPRLCAVRTDRRVQGCAVPADVSDARGVRGGRHAVAQCSLRRRPRAQSHQFPARPGQPPAGNPRRARQAALVASLRQIQGRSRADEDIALPARARAEGRNSSRLRHSRKRSDRRATLVVGGAGDHSEQRRIRQPAGGPREAFWPFVPCARNRMGRRLRPRTRPADPGPTSRRQMALGRGV